MKISTKGRYGLRALVDLAVYSQGEPTALAMVAARQKISLNYLEQVFGQLRKAEMCIRDRICLAVIIKRSKQQKKNPYKNEIFTDQKDFQSAMERAEV